MEMRLEPGEAAIVTEIYLPQEYAKSRVFQQVLSDSLSPQRVRDHFRKTPERKVMGRLPESLQRDYAELRGRIIRSKRAFSGYSVYDCSGAFVGDTGERQLEWASCVRIIDVPTPETLFTSKGSMPDDELFQRIARAVFGSRSHHDPWPKLASTLDVDTRAAARIYRRLKQWTDEGATLLYGFLGHHLVEITQGREQEILLTSHFAVVNRYRRLRLPNR